jgi:hypothetical protein
MLISGHYIYYIDDKNDVWRINTRIPGSDEVIIWNFGYNFDYHYYYFVYEKQHTIRRLKVNDSMGKSYLCYFTKQSYIIIEYVTVSRLSSNI